MALKKLITGLLAVLLVVAFSAVAFADVTGKTYNVDGIQIVKVKIKKGGKEKLEQTIADTLIFHGDGTFENVTEGIVGTWEYISKKKIMITIAPEVFEGLAEYMLSLYGDYDTTATYRGTAFFVKVIEKKDGSIKSISNGIADVVFHGLLNGEDATGKFQLKIKFQGTPQLEL